MDKPQSAGNPYLAYVPALDGLRGLALIGVLGAHTFPHKMDGGGLGLDVFFVLSGFLITTLLCREWQKTGTVNLKQYIFRRLLRVMPAMFVIVAFALVWSQYFFPPEGYREVRKAAVGAIFYYGNWRSLYTFKVGNPAVIYNMLMHTWSLNVEEQFYFTWPLILVVMLWFQVRRRWLILATIAGAVTSASLRFYLFPTWQNLLHFRTDTRSEGLFIGCLVGIIYTFGMMPTSRWATWTLRLAAPVALGLLIWESRILSHRAPFLYRGGFTLVNLEAAIVILGLLAAPRDVLSRVLSFPLFPWLGRISYGTYLWNFALIYTYRELAPRLGHERFPYYLLAASLVAGAMSFYLVERPFLRLKHWSSPRGARPVTVPAVGTVRAAA